MPAAAIRKLAQERTASSVTIIFQCFVAPDDVSVVKTVYNVIFILTLPSVCLVLQVVVHADIFKGDHIGGGGEVMHLYSGRSCLPALETSGALPPLHKVGLRNNTPVNMNHS